MGEFSIQSQWLPEHSERGPAFFRNHATAFTNFDKTHPESSHYYGETYPMRSRLYDRKDPRYFCDNRQIEKWNSYRKDDQEENSLFETISKVISVCMAILSVLMPLAICYMPEWVPWGIGVPLGLALLFGKGMIESKIEVYKKENEFVPYLSGVMNHHTLKGFEPIGVNDLPLVDYRLKSERLMKNKKEEESWFQTPLQKKQPKAWDSRYDLDQISYKKENVSAVATRIDLEVNSGLKYASALQFSEKTEKIEQWKTIKEKQRELFQAAQKSSAVTFTKIFNELEAMSYEPMTINRGAEMGGKVVVPCHPSLEYRAPSAERHYDSLVQLYRHGFSNPFESLQKIFEEGAALYGLPLPEFGPLTKKQAQCTPYVAWMTYLSFARIVKEELETHGKDPTYRLSLRSLIYELIGETRTIKRILEQWVEQHPRTKHAALQLELDQLSEKILTSKKTLIKDRPKDQLGQFVNWLSELKLHKNPKIKEVIQDLPKDLKSWIQIFPEMKEKEVREVFDAAFKATKKFEEARKKWASVAIESEAIEKYQKETLIPLKKAVAKQGKGSLWYRLSYSQKTPFSKPALPKSDASPKVTPSTPEATSSSDLNLLPEIRDALSHLKQVRHLDEPRLEIVKLRSFEEIRLNERLRHVDNEMTQVHYARVYGLRLPLALLIAIEGVVFFYFSSPWIFWGFSAIAAVGEGISYFVDKKLEKIEKQKQTIQLQYILRDYPNIGVVPGTHPRLEPIKKVQQQYGLEGVRPTWARLLVEPNAPEEPFEKIEQATLYLKDALLNLKTQRNRIEIQCRLSSSVPLENEKTKIKRRIDDLEKVLFPNRKKQLTKEQEKTEKEAEKKRLANLEKFKTERATFKKLESLTRRTCMTVHGLCGKSEDIEKDPALQKLRAERKEIPDNYSLVVRERQIVDEMLDLLVKEKFSIEHDRNDNKKAMEKFRCLYEKLTPQFAQLPVSLKEIDFILDSLKNETLQEQPISIVPLLLHIKQAIAKNPFLFKERREMQKIPPEERLEYAKALRELMILQLDPLYGSYEKVCAKYKEANDSLDILEKKIQYFKGEYNRLFEICQSLDPSLKVVRNRG